MIEKLKSLDNRTLVVGAALIIVLAFAVFTLLPGDRDSGSDNEQYCDPYEMIERLEKRGYEVSIISGEEQLREMFSSAGLPAEFIEKIDLVFGAVNMEIEEMGIFFCFNDKKIAVEFFEQLIAAGEEFGPTEIVERSGLICYIGANRIWNIAQ